MIIVRTMISSYGIWCMVTTFDVFCNKHPGFVLYILVVYHCTLCLNAIEICSLD